MIDIKFIGDWKITSRALRNLPQMVQSAGTWGQRKAAEKLVSIVKGHINNQDLGWAPRSVLSNSGDSRILVDDGDYYASIKAWKSGGNYFAGVPKNSVNEKGIPIIEYALTHEHGFKGIPARPLWGPSFDEIGGKKGIQGIIKLAISNKLQALRSKGFEV